MPTKPRKTVKRREKITLTSHGNEKPISLHPLKFEEALAGILAVKPPKDEDEPEKDEKASKSKKK